jgi:CRAL/TRIO domain
MWIFNIYISRMSEKVRERVILHENIDDLKNHIDEDNLPIEYGGKLEMKSIINKLNEEIGEQRGMFALNDEMCLNLDLYPSSLREMTLSSFDKTIEEIIEDEKNSKYSELDDLRGSFKKLEID